MIEPKEKTMCGGSASSSCTVRVHVMGIASSAFAAELRRDRRRNKPESTCSFRKEDKESVDDNVGGSG